MLEPNLSRTVASADVSGDLENHFLPLVNLLMAENEIKSLNRKTFKELVVSSFVSARRQILNVMINWAFGQPEVLVGSVVRLRDFILWFDRLRSTTDHHYSHKHPPPHPDYDQ